VGTLLAQIDDTVYVAQVEQARAGCLHAQAELAQAKAKLALAKAEWQRAQEQAKAKSISTADLDVARCAYEVARAGVALADATFSQNKASLEVAELNLSWTRIRSPIKGVVIDRRVNLGQMIVPGGGASSLFLIANDLKKVQVWVSVNEADIGKIREKQAVRFTVDAYSGETFQGKVAQIRLNATMTQNVVTYTVVVTTDNSNERLLPYLTANVQFEVARRDDVLRVPNAALRWRPLPQWIAPEVREKMSAGSRKADSRVWVRDGKFVRPITVQTGLSDATMTEIVGGDLTEGMKVIVGGSMPMTDAGYGAAGSQSLKGRVMEFFFTTPASRKAMQQALASMGTNQLLVMPGTKVSGGVSFGIGSISTLTPQDADEIARQCPAVSQAAPLVRARPRIVYGDRNWIPNTTYGTTPAFLEVREWEELAEGAAFTDADVRNASKVCLIGQTLKRELFQGDSPLGKEIRIDNVAFKVIGVLGRKGANIMGLDQDDIVLAPWTTIISRVKSGKAAADQSASAGGSRVSSLYPGPSAPGGDAPRPEVNVDQIVAKAATAEQIPQAVDEITQLLHQRHHIRPGQDDDFNIRDMTELVKAVNAPFR
jgi:RND family efflux transporter MFP subunit